MKTPSIIKSKSIRFEIWSIRVIKYSNNKYEIRICPSFKNGCSDDLFDAIPRLIKHLGLNPLSLAGGQIYTYN